MQRTVPRERYREPRYNLLRDGADPALYFLYDLLDRSLMESPEARLQNGTEFLKALDAALEKMDNNAHVLDLKVPQKCVFCIEGRYELRLAHNPTAYEFFGSNQFNQKP